MSERRLGWYLDQLHELAPLVRDQADRSEQAAQLAPDIVEAFHRTGLFRCMLPGELGGGDLSVPDSLRVFEAAGRLDGSSGWNLAICADGPLFAHYLPRQSYDEIFADPRALIGGSLNPMQTRVVPDDGGWRFSGKATYVSGSAQINWIMVAGFELEDGSPQLVDGVPLMRAGLFPMRHCRVLDTWSVSGMRGTGSNDCVFADVLVADRFTYRWPEPHTEWKGGPFAAIPLTLQLGGALAAVVLGAARHALDALDELAAVKVPAGTRATLRDRPLAQIQRAQAEGLVGAARAYLFQTYDDAWRAGAAGARFDNGARAAARLASVTAVKLAAQAVDLVHDAAGATSIQTACPIERCWRDVHAMTQHIILSTGRFEIIGRVLFGLDPGTPII